MMSNLSVDLIHSGFLASFGTVPFFTLVYVVCAKAKEGYDNLPGDYWVDVSDQVILEAQLELDHSMPTCSQDLVVAPFQTFTL